MTTCPANRTGPRPLGLYYAMLQQGAVWQQLLQQNPLFGQVLEQFSHLLNLPKDPALFLKGVERYRTYPWQRPQPEQNYQPVAAFGRAQLYQCREDNGGPPVLLVPSFINKPYILDLLPDVSLAGYLHQQGFMPYLMDWGNPTENDPAFTVETAITDALVPALDSFTQPPAVVGYCMGGVLALGAAALAPQSIASLALLATPWDFAATQTHQSLSLNNLPLEPMFDVCPMIPFDIIQTLFVELDPLKAFQRMETFATLTDHDILQRMTAIEDWLADGWPLEPSIARTLIVDWHRDNHTCHGTWKVGGTAVKPQHIHTPALVVVPEKDSLVPPACSAPLADQLANATRLNVPMGHVGLMSGRKTTNLFYAPLAKWLTQRTLSHQAA